MKSPEIDCNCDNKVDVTERLGQTMSECEDCGKRYILVGTCKDDAEWVEVPQN